MGFAEYPQEFASRPMRARGLKRATEVRVTEVRAVAPHAGAWIETTRDQTCLPCRAKSRPMRARGLKQKWSAGCNSVFASRPMRARGLKPAVMLHVVTADWSRPMRARGLKHGNALPLMVSRESRPMRARGLKLIYFPHFYISLGRAPCGRVD